MSEEHVSEVTKKKKKHVVPVSVFVGVALFVLILGAIILYAVEQRKKMISALDKRLGQRKDKIISLDQWHIDAMRAYERDLVQNRGEEATIEYPLHTNRLDSGYLLIDGRTVLLASEQWDTYSARAVGSDSITEVPTTYKKDSYSAFAIPDTDFAYNYESLPCSTLIVDPDEDSVFVKDDIPYICYGGYIYRSTFKYSSDTDGLVLGREGMNAQSLENRALREAAFSLLSESRRNSDDSEVTSVQFGFEGDYRYCIFYSVTGYSMPNLKTEDMYDLHVDDLSNYSEYDLGEDLTGIIYLQSDTVIFQDAKSELSSWKKQVMTAGVIGFVIFSVLLIGTILWEKKNQMVRNDEVKEAPSEDTGNAPAERIQADIADTLMEKINAAENSMGPNGYLEEIRETIEKMKK